MSAATATAEAPSEILVPDWYAPMLGPPCRSVDDAVAARFPARLVKLAKRLGPLMGLLTFLVSAGAERVALPKNAPGTKAFLALEALARRRRTVLVAFLVRALPRARWRRLLYGAWFRLVERPSIRRAMALGCVLNEWERREYAELYGIPVDRLPLVHWALSRGGEELPPFDAEAPAGVVCSGRAECDWETMFEAARGSPWPLTVICGERDLKRVGELNRDRADVFCELPRREHDERVRAAAIYVLCLEEGGQSAGHVRLMAAVDCGVPVIASAVRGLEDYVEDGRTAILVPPADPQRLRDAIDRLLEDPAARRALRQAAFQRARKWTYGEYFGAIRSLLLGTEETAA